MSNKKLDKREYLDEYGWQVIEYTVSPTITVTFKHNHGTMVIFNGSELRYKGDYDPKLLKEVIEEFESQRSNNNPNNNQQSEDYYEIDNSPKNSGGCCGCCLIFVLIILAFSIISVLGLHSL